MYKLLKRTLSIAMIMALFLNISVYGADVMGNSVFFEENSAENNGQLTVEDENDLGEFEIQEEENGEIVPELPKEEDEGSITIPELPKEEGEGSITIPELPKEEGDGSITIPELPNFDDPISTIPPVDENIDGEMMVDEINFKNVDYVGKDVSDLLKPITNSLSQDDKEIAENEKIDINKPISIGYEFKVPVELDNVLDFVEGNDYAEFDLPEKLVLKNDKAVDIINGGVKIGTLTFDKVAHKAKIVFSEELVTEGLNNVDAKFTAIMDADITNLPNTPGDHTLIILGKEYSYTIPARAIKIELEKSGKVNYEKQSITWTVTVKANYENDKADAPLKDYSFYDDLTSIGEYKTGTFDIEGNSVTPKYEANILSYNFSDTDLGEKIITFETAISDNDFYISTGLVDKITKKNTAKIFKGTSEISKKDAIVDIVKPTWIVKNYEANAQTKEIKWNIEANELSFGFEEVVITDKITNPNLTFKSANLYKKVNGFWESSPYKTWKDQPQKDEYEIGDINYPIRLEIITEAKNSGVEVEYKNQASISWKDENGNGRGYSSKEIKFKFGTALINKRATAYNYATHVIDWEINLLNIGAGYGKDQRIVELIVYGENKYFDPDKKAYTIDGMTTDINSAAYISEEVLKVIKKSEKQKYVDGSFDEDGSDDLELNKYTVKENGVAVADLIVITAKDGKPIIPTHNHIVTYETIVTDPSIYAANHDDKAHYITNTVNLLDKDKIVGFQPASQEIRSNMIMKENISREEKDNLFKDKTDVSVLNSTKGGYGGDFDYTTNSALYKIHINLNGIDNLTQDVTMAENEKLGAITVTEKLPDGWEFKPLPDGELFWLYEGSPDGDRKKVVATSFYENDKNTNFTSNFDTVKNQLTLNFDKMNKSYVLVVEARPTADKLKEYFSVKKDFEAVNTASISANTTLLGKSEAKTKVVANPLHKSLNKKDAASQGFLIWTVDYKPYGAAFENLHIEDQIPQGADLRVDSDGKIVIKDNIKVNKLKISQNGYAALGDEIDLEKQSNIIAYDSQTKVLRFNIPDCKENYRLTYVTEITGDEGLEVTNKVSLKGGTFTAPESEDKYKVEKNAASASFSRNGWVEIDKVNELSLPLGGAEFTLYNHDKSTVVRKGISNDKGNLKLGAIPEGSYILKETIAPVGYILDETEYKVTVVKNGGKPITTIEGKSDNKIEVINRTENNYGSLKISKIINGSAVEADKDFTFTLELKNGVDYGLGTFSYVKTLGADESKGKLNLDVQGKVTFTLKGDESIIIKDLPKDWTYSVTEDDYSDELYVTSYEKEKGSIIAGTLEQVKVINERNNPDFGSLVISKEVSGSGGEHNREFKFSIEFSKNGILAANEKIDISKLNVPSEIELDSNGKYVFYLKANESIRFDKFVKGWSYEVVEEDYSADGYETKVTGDKKALIEVGKQTDVKFVNTKENNNGSGGGDSGNTEDNDNPPKDPDIPLIPLEPSVPSVPQKPIIPQNPNTPLIPSDVTDVGTVEGVNTETDVKSENPKYDKDGKIIKSEDSHLDNEFSNVVQTGDETPLVFLFVMMFLCFGGALTLSKLRRKQ